MFTGFDFEVGFMLGFLAWPALFVIGLFTGLITFTKTKKEDKNV